MGGLQGKPLSLVRSKLLGASSTRLVGRWKRRSGLRYCYGIRSERRLCEEVHLNLAYRRFCRLGLDGEVPNHSTFSENIR